MMMFLFREIAVPLNMAVEYFSRMSRGDFTSVIKVKTRDEMGRLMLGLKSMQDKLGFELSEARRIGDGALQIKTGLDNVSTSVMIGDPEGRIVYCNRALLAMFRETESAIRKDLPQFEADKLIGTRFDSFYKDPAVPQALLAGITSTQRDTLKLGGRTFSLALNPVRNCSGERLGFAVEWADRTGKSRWKKKWRGSWRRPRRATSASASRLRTSMDSSCSLARESTRCWRSAIPVCRMWPACSARWPRAI
jgi:methyl-accepting chemotaxis protein